MLRTYSRDFIRTLVSERAEEYKLGQRVHTFSGSDSWQQELLQSKALFVLLGIPEDIGPRANYGQSGAGEMWNAFLSKWLNMQSNLFLRGEEILVAGEIETEDLRTQAAEADVATLRKLVEILDQRVSETVNLLVKAGKIPIIIGGGHNNAYGNLLGAGNALGRPLHCINIDPHADLRPLEGRHSGNGFSYARAQGCLDRYFVLGLHEAYNSDFIIEQLEREKALHYVSFDEKLRERLPASELAARAIDFMGHGPCGLELDLDSIAHFPSSAISPTGFTENEIRELIIRIAHSSDICYFHLCEGAPLNPETRGVYGKAVAYFVSDFIKTLNRKLNC